MKHITYLIGITISMLSIFGCASSHALVRTQFSPVPVRIHSKQGIQAKLVNISPSEVGVYVQGHVTNQLGYTKRTAHVHVNLKDSSNRLRKAYTTSINPVRIPIQRQGKKGVSHFIVNVSESIEKGNWIEVVVHAGSEHHDEG